MAPAPHPAPDVQTTWRLIHVALVVIITLTANIMFLTAMTCGSSKGAGVAMLANTAYSVGSHGHLADDAGPLESQQAKAETTGHVRVFVGVLSSSDSFEARQAVRETWGADGRLARVMFFTLRPKSEDVHLQLQQEAVQHGDLIVTSEMMDHYHNITYATLAVFRAAVAMGPDVDYVMKTDDDSYIRVSRLLAALQQLPRQLLYTGTGYSSPLPIPRPPAGWGIPFDNWPKNGTVRYAWGLGYLLSMDLARYMAAGAPHMIMRPDNLVIVEDIAVGLWVEAVAQRHNLTVAYDRSLPIEPHACNASSVITHLKGVPSRWVTIRCMHQRGGGCCNHGSN